MVIMKNFPIYATITDCAEFEMQECEREEARRRLIFSVRQLPGSRGYGFAFEMVDGVVNEAFDLLAVFGAETVANGHAPSWGEVRNRKFCGVGIALEHDL